MSEVRETNKQIHIENLKEKQIHIEKMVPKPGDIASNLLDGNIISEGKGGYSKEVDKWKKRFIKENLDIVTKELYLSLLELLIIILVTCLFNYIIKNCARS
jgi:hypothetical protein